VVDFSRQWKYLHWEVEKILHCEMTTCQVIVRREATVIVSFLPVPHFRLLFHQSEATEAAHFRFQHNGQNI
jgi:hypothetical protein